MGAGRASFGSRLTGRSLSDCTVSVGQGLQSSQARSAGCCAGLPVGLPCVCPVEFNEDWCGYTRGAGSQKMRFEDAIRLRHTRTVTEASAVDASDGSGSTSRYVRSCSSMTRLNRRPSSIHSSARIVTGVQGTETAGSKTRGFCECVASSQSKKRLRADAVEPPSDRQRYGVGSMASVQRCLLQRHIDGNGYVETRASRSVSEAPVVAGSRVKSPRKLQPWTVYQDGVGVVQRFGGCSSTAGKRPGVTSSLEAVLSAFPFLLPIEGGKSPVPPSAAALRTGASVGTDNDQQREVLRAALKGLGEVAADLAVEMGDLRRSGEQLAELLPGGSFPFHAGRSDLPNSSGTATCSKVRGRNSLCKCSGKRCSVPDAYLWCDCVASVTASIESSVLSVMYEKEASQLFQQDVLDTKFRWWRAVRKCFAGRCSLETLDADVPHHWGQKCCRAAGGLHPRKMQGKHTPSPIGVTLEDDKSHSLLQHWICCCFCSPISRAYLLKAHEQLYYVRDKGLCPLLQAADCSSIVSYEDHEATAMPSNDSIASIFAETEGKELKRRTGAKKATKTVALDKFADALNAQRLSAGLVVYKGYRSGSFEKRQMCGFQSDTEKRRRIWQWLWEAASALGFCASSRFLAMQLLDAYLQHEGCMVDVSKTSQVATAAVAAVLLAAASRCHWKDVQNDAFLVALLRNLELPSTADDVIQTQADMLRLLPTFLFTVRSPVDYLVCFLTNLRWLPQILEHGSRLELTCSQEGPCLEFARKTWAEAKAHISQEGLSTQAPAPWQRFDTSIVGLPHEEEQSSDDAGEASTQPGDAQQSRTHQTKDSAYKGLTSGSYGVDGATSTDRCIFPVLLSRTASHGVTPVKRVVSLFDYWRCTGLLGCLEGLMLRCCSAFVASATLCARVPMSRVLAVLLLQIFEPYSRHRLQHPQGTTTTTLSEESAGNGKVGPCAMSEERTERGSCFTPSFVERWAPGLLEWCRCISTNVFRMHFDADLLFWKILLQPLVDQLLHLPENRPFLVLWQRGAEEWALLLERCSRATSRCGDDGAERDQTITSCLPTKGSTRGGTSSCLGPKGLAGEYVRAST